MRKTLLKVLRTIEKHIENVRKKQVSKWYKTWDGIEYEYDCDLIAINTKLKKYEGMIHRINGCIEIIEAA